MRVELLGTVQVRDDGGGPAHLGGPRARALLALLALNAGRAVPAGTLIDRLWDGDPPEGARGALQSMVSRVRGVLGDAIESHPAGYRLALGRDQVDALAFEELAGQGSRALAGGDAARASVILRQALALWRGPALAGLPAAEQTAGIAARLEELRRSATADRIEADLTAADAADTAGLTAELRALIDEDPLSERPRALLMRALYLAGRQADALAVYADARAQLAAELGVDPSPQLEQVYLGVLRRSLPTAREAAAAPLSTLRVPLTSLVGRDGQVAQAEALTDDNRLVTLTGPGGVGKTRLAAEVAARVAARAGGGVWLVELAPLSDPGDVPYAALTAVGIRDAGVTRARGSGPGQTAGSAHPAPDPASRLVSGLRERSGLMVLDNCEHLIDAVAALADAVLSGCPGISILAASRESLGITGETVFPVPPLPVPPDSRHGGDRELAAITAAASVRLLADRARAVRPGFAVTGANAADVARICRVLDGMPLAIELAAARLRTMSPAQLTRRLDDRFTLLTGGSRTAVPRHQTLRAVVEWSWDLLSGPEQVLARRLAALPAGATLLAAEGICCDEPGAPGGGLQAGAILDALAGLADKSFLIVDGDSEPRYRMLDTIRAYCLGQLAEAGEEDTVRDRMRDYYLALAETAEPLLRTRAQRPWFGVLAAESGNMHAAMHWAIERGDAGAALRFGAALAWYWYVCGQLGDSAPFARAALALEAAGPQPADRASVEARAVCAVIAASADWDLDAVRKALEAAAAAADADPSGRALHPLAVYARTQMVRFGGDGERALGLLAGYLDSGDPWTGAAARLQSAIILHGLGRIEEASLGCAAALALFRGTGETWGTTMALTFQAELGRLGGDYGGAIAALEEAVALDRQLAEVPEDLAWLYQQLAALRVRTGDYAAAHAVLDLADQNAAAEGDLGPYLRLIRAVLAWREGNPAEATRLCEYLLREEGGRPAFWAPLRALAGTRLGVLALEAGDIARGTALLREALGTAATAGDRPAAAVAVEGLAAAALRAGGAERAVALLGAADSIRGAVDHGSLDAPAVRTAAAEQLGAAAFDAAYQRGLDLPYDEALDFAGSVPGR